MPRAGGASTRLAQVMALAHEQLAREAAGTAGTVLVVSDGHDLALPATVAAPPTLLWLFGDGAAAPLAVDSRGAASGLRAGSVPARDEAALDALLAQHDMARIDARVDDGDVDAVNRRIEQQLAQAAETRADRAWRDDGVLLLWPLLALAALGFRRGWGLRW